MQEDKKKPLFLPVYSSHPRTTLQHAGYPVLLAPCPSKVPEIPGWNRSTTTLGSMPASRTPSLCDSVTHEKTRKDALEFDGACLLTGIPDVCLELAHIISPVRPSRGSGNLSLQQAQLKKNIEELLGQLGFNPYSNVYQLDGLSNCILLNISYHRKWDTYHLMCFSPSKGALDELISDLKQDNKDWERGVVAHNPTRPTRAAWQLKTRLGEEGLELLVIRPTHFLHPRASMHTIDDHPFKCIPGTPYLEDSITRERFKIRLPHSRLADPDGAVSPFALIHNAYFKLDYYLKQNPRKVHVSELKEFHRRLEEAFKLIFWFPSSHEIMKGLEDLHLGDSEETQEDDAREDAGEDCDAPGQGSSETIRRHSTAGNPDMDMYESESSYCDSLYAPDEDEGGLYTDQEFRKIMRTAFDVSVDDSERMEAIRMFSMALQAPPQPIPTLDGLDDD